MNNTYSVTMKCSNCDEIAEVQIRKGVRVSEYKGGCPHCGCPDLSRYRDWGLKPRRPTPYQPPIDPPYQPYPYRGPEEPWREYPYPIRITCGSHTTSLETRDG